MIKFLNEQTGNTPDSFHIVGFSLGAQVSGYAGKRFQDITKKKVARITGKNVIEKLSDVRYYHS